MEIFLWILIGFGLGSVARLVMPGPRAGGIGVAIGVGIGGALIGGFMGSILTGEGLSAFHVDNQLMALAGSLILLLGYRAFATRLSEDEQTPDVVTQTVSGEHQWRFRSRWRPQLATLIPARKASWQRLICK